MSARNERLFDSIVRQTNKRSFLFYTTMNNIHIFNDKMSVVFSSHQVITILHFYCCLQIHVYLILCVLTVVTSILMFWLIMPIIVNDNREVSWNMFFGSFLGLVAITFVVSMKGSFVAFKASFFQYNCCNKVPQLQVSEFL